MWQRYIDGQYRRPTGLIGRWVGRKMAEQHQPENNWTVKVLNIQPTDHVLEVGFGPGFAVQEVAKVAQFVAGVDFSQAMVSAASTRNAAAIRAGRVRLQDGDSSKLPFEDQSFDKAFSIHSIYFWTQPTAALREIWRVLKPNGLLFLTTPNYASASLRVIENTALEAVARMQNFSRKHIHPTKMTPDRLSRVLRDAGANAIHIEQISFGWVLAGYGRRSP